MIRERRPPIGSYVEAIIDARESGTRYDPKRRGTLLVAGRVRKYHRYDALLMWVEMRGELHCVHLNAIREMTEAGAMVKLTDAQRQARLERHS